MTVARANNIKPLDVLLSMAFLTTINQLKCDRLTLSSLPHLEGAIL